MSLFSRKKKNDPAVAADPEAPVFTFERQYTNAQSFRGYKRLYVTVFNDYDNSEINANALLNGGKVCNCVDRLITLKGIEGPNYRGIAVYIDPEQYPMGTIWERPSEPLFSTVYDGNYTNVYLRIEADNPHPKVYLFVELNQ